MCQISTAIGIRKERFDPRCHEHHMHKILNLLERKQPVYIIPMGRMKDAKML